MLLMPTKLEVQNVDDPMYDTVLSQHYGIVFIYLAYER
jgi:hypothetical protein